MLRDQLRTRMRRNPQPSAGIIDSQSVRTTGVGGVRGYDGAKRVNGRKPHILVDSLGLVLRAKVHAADIQDRAGVPLLLAGVADRYPRIEHLWVDQGYTGSGKSWIEEHLGWRVDVVRGSLIGGYVLIGTALERAESAVSRLPPAETARKPRVSRSRICALVPQARVLQNVV